MNWFKDVPNERGFYWIRTHSPISPEIFKKYLVVHITKTDAKWCYGPCGSGPLEYYYSPTRSGFAKIPDPTNWTKFKQRSGKEYMYGWVRTNKYFGFGILRGGWHNDVNGVIMWTNHELNASSSGDLRMKTDSFEFSEVNNYE